MIVSYLFFNNLLVFKLKSEIVHFRFYQTFIYGKLLFIIFFELYDALYDAQEDTSIGVVLISAR